MPPHEVVAGAGPMRCRLSAYAADANSICGTRRGVDEKAGVIIVDLQRDAATRAADHRFGLPQRLSYCEPDLLQRLLQDDDGRALQGVDGAVRIGGSMRTLCRRRLQPFRHFPETSAPSGSSSAGPPANASSACCCKPL